MSTRPDPDIVIASWLRNEAGDGASDRLLAAARRQIESTHQRRTFWAARRSEPMNSGLKVAFAATAVVAVVAVGAYLVPRSGGLGGPGPATPSPQPSPSIQTARMWVAGSPLGSTLRLTAQLPGNWNNNRWVATNGVDAPYGTAFFAGLVDNTFQDPCTHVQRTPRLGSSVEALTTALGEIPNLTASKPIQATIAGHSATYVELTIPASLPCAPDQFYLWQDSPQGYLWVLAPGESIGVWILEAQGQRVVIGTRSWPATTVEMKAELQRVLDSIVFDDSTTQPSTSPAAS
jgi:hypothetical protein